MPGKLRFEAGVQAKFHAFGSPLGRDKFIFGLANTTLVSIQHGSIFLSQVNSEVESTYRDKFRAFNTTPDSPVIFISGSGASGTRQKKIAHRRPQIPDAAKPQRKNEPITAPSTNDTI